MQYCKKQTNKQQKKQSTFFVELHIRNSNTVKLHWILQYYFKQPQHCTTPIRNYYFIM